jgi:ATP-dependent Clp protease ATP-binding subunit ClpC
MPKINVYLPDELAEAVRDAQLPVSAICQSALERAVRDVTSVRGSDQAPQDDSRMIGLFARFTPRARQAFVLADARAREIPNNFVGTEHLLLGMLDEGGNLALGVLRALDIEPADLRAELVASVEPGHAPGDGGIPFTPLAKEALETAVKEALTLGHNYLGCEHLLLGVLATEEGLGSKVLRRMGLELRTTRRAVVTALTGVVHQMKQATAAPIPAPAEDALQEILRRLDGIERRLGD